jgi:hypothetical protein
MDENNEIKKLNIDLLTQQQGMAPRVEQVYVRLSGFSGECQLLIRGRPFVPIAVCCLC